MYNGSSDKISDQTSYEEVVVTTLVFLVLFHFIVNIILASSTHFGYQKLWKERGIQNSRRVLFIVAHPDDECMFFGPTILATLKSNPKNIYVLCMSTGDFDGKGAQRKQELWDSCTSLGVLPENVILIKHDHLKDGPNAVWSFHILSPVILHHIQSLQIDTLITFDDYGVSGHTNHTSIHYCIRELLNKKQLPEYCQPYFLESVNIMRKYFGILYDVPWCYFNSEYMYIAAGKNRRRIQDAMACHRSQYVWFRKLFIVFSRYLVVNTLVGLPNTKSKKTLKSS